MNKILAMRLAGVTAVSTLPFSGAVAPMATAKSQVQVTASWTQYPIPGVTNTYCEWKVDISGLKPGRAYTYRSNDGWYGTTFIADSTGSYREDWVTTSTAGPSTVDVSTAYTGTTSLLLATTQVYDTCI